ncbi:PD-(D/E)XK nuclease-like domain-containing protein [Arthrobacter jiangjiafuii]|uniref:PD-(D/E)XK nuclease-like domain-containing protein n=1 Tax=Arthrobacter jiangjiafuii TaxID=2817475 RepID=A0A975M6G3_9MICC|nr:PD-(D/E)XK nuclease-like domain-containing protein [Arthrobacter jiangjiafuii]MBP3044860.1 PD-(D/E)XK nuclease-like domain-containing protein [Arthrobacter jiangjiafuii]QWC10316.1 PD-(D/E)XK nuclease-like domain-containing protein [Arthrobacter jiangjiafuii]
MTYSPGIYADISNRDYHADPALGSTSLKTLALKTPAHYQHDKAHPKSSDAFTLGTAAHSLILEGDTSNIVIVDAANWLTKAAKEAKAEALAVGKQPLLTKEMAQIEAMRDSVMLHEVAGLHFIGHKAEQSIFWEEDGLMLKCRPDAWKPGTIVDLKTTVDASPNSFSKTAFDFGYFMSAAHYIDGVKAATGEDVKFVFVNVEKTAPYLVSVVELDDYTLDCGRQMLDRAKRIYRECTETGKWPGYPAVEPVGLPAYANYQLDDLLGINQEMDISL